MIDIQLREYGLLRRWTETIEPPRSRLQEAWLPAPLYDRLEAWDGRRKAAALFDWRSGFCRTTNWVGVVDLPGVRLELLPKIAQEAEEEHLQTLRHNLLHMLVRSGLVPVRTAEVTDLTTRQGPLLETFVKLFADRLHAELTRGRPHAYERHEHDLRTLRGRLDVQRQVTRHAARRDLFACRYDLFTPDTPLNQLLRAACKYVLPRVRLAPVQQAVGRCLGLLEDVRDVAAHQLLDRVTTNRQSERFEDVLQFAQLLLREFRPEATRGQNPGVALVYDMNVVFERYVAYETRRYVDVHMPGWRVRAQSHGERKALFREGGKDVLVLRPDIVVTRVDGPPIVLDTKWKLLAQDGSQDPANADLYQMHAYQRRYGAERTVLVYPGLGPARPRDFVLAEGADGTSLGVIQVRQVPLGDALWKNGGLAVQTALGTILGPSLT